MTCAAERTDCGEDGGQRALAHSSLHAWYPRPHDKPFFMLALRHRWNCSLLIHSLKLCCIIDARVNIFNNLLHIVLNLYSHFPLPITCIRPAN